MDSTFLGTLLYLNRAGNRSDRGDFALVCPSPDCRRLMQQMGVEDVFPMVADEKVSEDTWVEVTEETSDLTNTKHAVVQAHLELAALEGPAGAPFREVVRCLHELEKETFPTDTPKALSKLKK